MDALNLLVHQGLHMICIFTKMPSEIAVVLVKKFYLDSLKIINLIDQTTQGDSSRLRKITILPLTHDYEFVPRPIADNAVGVPSESSDDFATQAKVIMDSVIKNLYKDRTLDLSNGSKDYLDDWIRTYRK